MKNLLMSVSVDIQGSRPAVGNISQSLHRPPGDLKVTHSADQRQNLVLFAKALKVTVLEHLSRNSDIKIMY